MCGERSRNHRLLQWTATVIKEKTNNNKNKIMKNNLGKKQQKMTTKTKEYENVEIRITIYNVYFGIPFLFVSVGYLQIFFSYHLR